MKKNCIKSLLLMLLFMPLVVFASGVDNVSYQISDVYMSVEVDMVGSLHIKEAIVVKGSLNGFRRKIDYRNASLKPWKEGGVDLTNSSIYNAKGISLKKASSAKIDEEKIDWKLLDYDYDKFAEMKSGYSGLEKSYTNRSDENGSEIKIYDPNYSGYKVYFFDYFIDQAVVLHEDVAELYYTLFKLDNESADKVNIQVITPGLSKSDTFRAWAHGPLNGALSVVGGDKTSSGEETYKGAILTVDYYDGESPIEIRMTFDRNLVNAIPGILNESKMDALDEICEIEGKRFEESDRKKIFIKIVYYGTCVIASLYILGLIFLWIYLYKKFDKEYDVGFDHKYYREFTGDYEVEVVDYLMKKNITTDAFNASIMNLIYKKNIRVEEDPKDKKDFTLILLSENKLNDSEKILIDLLFNMIGSDKKVTLKEVEKYSSKFETAEQFMKRYEAWKLSVQRTAKQEGFFEEHMKPAVIGTVYMFLGILVFFLLMHFKVDFYLLHILVMLGAITFFIYTLTIKKWTHKGREHYLKWEAFKNFLKDFGSFKEKEIPEIALWDKYLVYATVFGIAKEVQKSMKVQLSNLGIEENTISPGMFYYRDFYLMNSLNRSFSKAHTNSMTTVNSHNANSTLGGGSGFGGGFSGGGGFAGGGGGGGGF